MSVSISGGAPPIRWSTYCVVPSGPGSAWSTLIRPLGRVPALVVRTTPPTPSEFSEPRPRGTPQEQVTETLFGPLVGRIRTVDITRAPRRGHRA
nr:hypothetical protein GCM10025730_37440 [Promicromonospora thailandica]